MSVPTRLTRPIRTARTARAIQPRRFTDARKAVLATVVAGLLAAAGGVAAAAPASATVTLAAAGCPQTVAAQGFPIEPLEATAGGIVTRTAGAFPPGVQLNALGTVLFGEPSAVGRYRFRLQLTVTDPTGAIVTSEVNCAITVQQAPKVNRIGGADRYAQAIALSAAAFPTADLAYVVTGERFADALSAGSVGAQHHAPLLLTPSGALPNGLIDELKRLKVKDVVIVGGVNAVSAAVERALRSGSGAEVTRIGGADRYEVSRALISDARFGMPKTSSIFLATGTDFPDALTATPAAFTDGSPVMLVNGRAATLSSAEIGTLDNFGVREATIVGGPLTVSDALLKDITTRFAAERLAGADRYATGAIVNHDVFKSASRVFIASGATFPDALSGGVPAGVSSNPLYVTTPECLSPEVYFEIGRLAPVDVTILGGLKAVGPALDTLTPCALD
ncbi:cell wall-binding repeat-containing protein [Herbiconiux sp. CPCC 205716]|uniref:Cell wall-binding repeat-containing protein n=1 Tax=Herbiconiux gentiana TaxID=2970912 RepID=A0ABT2GGE1_9MICO|nr:cell wall-binding repeat-containing protein [Herbiconiux gentiana]MCS5713866.1 cell wall-binding repeat-containing protein [Herbiconiux gentiana]